MAGRQGTVRTLRCSGLKRTRPRHS
jgi:hypothetical protein